MEKSIDKKTHRQFSTFSFDFSQVQCHIVCNCSVKFLTISIVDQWHESVTQNKHLSYEEGHDTWKFQDVEWKGNIKPRISFFFLQEFFHKEGEKKSSKVIEVQNTEKLLFKCRAEIKTDKSCTRV